MDTLKLFHITCGTRGKNPDISYIITISLERAKNRYSNYDLDSSEGYEFTVVEEMEATKQNKSALILRQYVEDFNHYGKNSKELTLVEVDNRWNSFIEYLSIKEGELGLKKLFDIKDLKKRAYVLLKGTIQDCEKNIMPYQKTIEVVNNKLEFVKTLK